MVSSNGLNGRGVQGTAFVTSEMVPLPHSIFILPGRWGAFAARKLGCAIQQRAAYFFDIAAPCAGCGAPAPAELPSSFSPASSVLLRWSRARAGGAGWHRSFGGSRWGRGLRGRRRTGSSSGGDDRWPKEHVQSDRPSVWLPVRGRRRGPWTVRGRRTHVDRPFRRPCRPWAGSRTSDRPL